MQAAVQIGPQLSRNDFDFFRSKIFQLAGISLSEGKLDLLQARLRSRLTAKGMSDYSEYRQLLESLSSDHEEWESFINVLTTNKTDWFRENEHFNYIVNDFLPKWLKLGKKHLHVWCAASSTGEEPYTLALVLHEALKGTGVTFDIKASDIDTKVIAQARNGVYPKDRLLQVPDKYRSGFAAGTKEISGWIKVKREIKQNVEFHQLNLTKPPFKWDKPFDLVLCRNVLIYFNAQTITEVVQSIHQCSAPESVLIIAHSETLQNLKTSWKYFRPSIYTKGKVF